MDPRWRLHRARVEKSIELGRISALTALSPSVVRKIDDGRFEELPGGVYARSYVRAFAEVVGLSPEEAVRDVEALLPGAPDPFPALREQKGPSRLHALRSRVAGGIRQLRSGFARIQIPRPSVPFARTLAAFVRAELCGRNGEDALRRFGAATIDAIVLLIVCGVQTLLTAWICGVSLEVLLAEASGALAITLLVPVALYFFIFNGLAGRTPGSAALRTPRFAPRISRIQFLKKHSGPLRSDANPLSPVTRWQL